jgi:hypothetical protein
MNALIFAATGIAVTLLALGMPRHFVRAHHKQASRALERGLRGSGWLFLVASLGLSVAAWDEGVRLVLWVALLAFHAFALALLLAYRPRWTPFWPSACLALALLAALL